MNTRSFAAAVVAVCVQLSAVSAQDVAARETVTQIDNSHISNIPGKRLVSLIVEYPPGAKSIPHRHAGSAFIYAYVIAGEVKSAVDNEVARVYRAGEGWFENPGAHHVVSENASDKVPARLLAVFIVDESDKKFTVDDPR